MVISICVLIPVNTIRYFQVALQWSDRKVTYCKVLIGMNQECFMTVTSFKVVNLQLLCMCLQHEVLYLPTLQQCIAHVLANNGFFYHAP